MAEYDDSLPTVSAEAIDHEVQGCVSCGMHNGPPTFVKAGGDFAVLTVPAYMAPVASRSEEWWDECLARAETAEPGRWGRIRLFDRLRAAWRTFLDARGRCF